MSDQSKPTTGQNDFHPFSMARLSVWMRLAFKNGGIPRRYWGRFFKILLVSTLTLPLRIAESLVFSRRVNKVDVFESSGIRSGVRPKRNYTLA